MFGIVGEALYPYKVVSYDPQTQLGTVETLAEKGKQSKFRSAITMYGGPYLNMPVRMDVMLISEKICQAQVSIAVCSDLVIPETKYFVFVVVQ